MGILKKMRLNRAFTSCIAMVGALSIDGYKAIAAKFEKDSFSCPYKINGKNNSGRTPAIPYKNQRSDYQAKWKKKLAKIKPGTKVLFIGDSHIELWPSNLMKTLVKKPYVNLGIAGETVEELNWRVHQPELWQKIQPELVIIQSGINNAGANSDLEIADGLLQVINKIKSQPSVKNIVSFTLFPAGRKGKNGYRRQIKCVNSKLVAKTRNDPKVKIFTIYRDLVQPGTMRLTTQLSSDGLHFNTRGYTKITEKLKKFLAENNLR